MESLTLENAVELKGKKIIAHYDGGINGLKEIEFIVGDVISSYYLAERTEVEGFVNQARMWDKQMSAGRLQEVKETLELLRKDGSPTYIRSHKECGKQSQFTCSDIDRYVSFEIVKND